ncbi:NUDIX domain-containing protein [Ensifer sp. ENS11]|uniref:NUDIX domain-containing protein n=1 Tax=Ensifer sp. ENS11 TaxID=2769291 RepID=UPI0017846D1C|nr:NUDIX domain-containing protein [Ensifer sp. ENS11]MBD9491398.1 NUDIX domain-containing protein [Ensifer sp. ENS11]
MRHARILSSELLVKSWGSLTEYNFQYSKLSGELAEISREVYDRGHAAAVLLHNPISDMVVLVRQFRPPAMVNGSDPFLLEVCAGVLEGDAPETCARKEALEEAGVVVNDLRFVVSAYGLPAAVTEVLSLFIGTYDDSVRRSGGGLPDEGEDIEVIELPFQTAFQMISSGEIVDLKTIVLLQHLMLERANVPTAESART